MGDDYTSIPIPGWAGLTEVRLYDETRDHIVKEHAEFAMQLPSQQAGLEDAIADPTAIHASTSDPEKSVVIVSEAFTYFDNPVVVPVRRIEGTTSSRVVTAYFPSDPQKGKVLWSSSSG